MKYIKITTFIALILVVAGVLYAYKNKGNLALNSPSEATSETREAQNKETSPSQLNIATSTEKLPFNPVNTLALQISAMNRAFLDKDYKTYAKFVNPKVIEKMGGEQKFIEMVKDGIEGMESQGWVLTAINFEEPLKLIYTDTEIQSVLTQNMSGKIPDGKVVVTSYLMATSDNKGKNWYFFDTDENNLKTLMTAFPNLSAQLYIPPTKEPVFEYDMK